MNEVILLLGPADGDVTLEPFALAVIQLETGRFADAACSRRLDQSMWTYLTDFATSKDLVTQLGPNELCFFFADPGKAEVEGFIRRVAHASEMLASENVSSVQLVVWVGIARHTDTAASIGSLVQHARANRFQVHSPYLQLLTA